MEIKTIKTDKFEIDCAVFGSGMRTFVIIPGVSMKPIIDSANAVAMAFADFTKLYTVYLIDRKKGIQEPYSINEMAQDTADAMIQMGIRQADIFGASQGGMIAQQIALDHPKLVHGLYLASTMSRPNAFAKETFLRWMSLAEAGDAQALNHDANTHIYSPEYYNRYAMIFRMGESSGTPEEIKRFGHLVRACKDFDVYDRLDEIHCPVFAVGSRQDQVLSGLATEELAAKLNCPMYMYDGYSHAVYDEAPDFRTRMLKDLSELTWE